MAEQKDKEQELQEVGVQEPTGVIKTDVAEPQPLAPKAPKKSIKEFLKSKKGRITLGVVAGVILLTAILMAVPVTRYVILGPFVRKDVNLQVLDSKTGKPVSDAEVGVAGKSARTDHEGKATVGQVAVGQHQLSVKKKYYKDTSIDVTVPVLSQANAGEVRLEATGRQVPVSVTNKISGKAIPKATVIAGDATAITDSKGEAVLVMPAEAATVKATLRAEGYNEQTADVTVTEQKDPKNTLTMTPSGKLYFLSKRTGKISVMKSNLDGTDAKVVVEGTGKEAEGDTVLLASRDWKYLLLKSRRDGGDHGKLFLIDTATDQMSVVDEGDASFDLVGWNDHRFVYKVTRYKVPEYQSKRLALKSYDAESKKHIIIDENIAGGDGGHNYAVEFFVYIFLIDSEDRVVYNKEWYGNGPSMGGKQHTINASQTDGSGKKVLRSLDLGYYAWNAELYGTNEVYYRASLNGKPHYFEYEGGAVKEDSTIKDSDFGQFYPTYLISPSGEKTFWYEPRDGKNTLFIGDKLGEEGKEIAALSDFVPYGWYSNDYLLVSKGGSELFILPASSPDAAKAMKITDYHKPQFTYLGYGGGYGGL